MKRPILSDDRHEQDFAQQLGKTLASAEPNSVVRAKLAAAREQAVQASGPRVHGSVLSRVHGSHSWRWGISALLVVAALTYWQQARQQQNVAATQDLVDEVIYYSLDY
ncbi:hypothetical protein HQ393_16610 [Chitinibacter bivalviorum]|uniref:DUF3619 family protein n=1 Tax=Chitinibacter bivalviorum TaxID=2739434 RepID=A0A7H9BMF1_9NEIS|nr:hypothetical protein [Chitinibacter bivalviorum]QLG89735.1 hypothetical protein HQ393_16610 [Chitinibacter bivalviorum]